MERTVCKTAQEQPGSLSIASGKERTEPALTTGDLRYRPTLGLEFY